jgi:hypothetical protein
VDAVIANNPDKTLDELVAEKKINEDQKAQALKKPVLQATIAQLEEQIAHYKEFATFYEQRLASQKAELEKAQKEVEALREKAATATPAPAEQTPEVKKEDASQQLLSVSRFLSTAAIRRHRGEDETTAESRAFEGVLAQVYGGHLDAVASMQKLIDGADEKVVSVDGERLEVTCKFLCPHLNCSKLRLTKTQSLVLSSSPNRRQSRQPLRSPLQRPRPIPPQPTPLPPNFRTRYMSLKLLQTTPPPPPQMRPRTLLRRRRHLLGKVQMRSPNPHGSRTAILLPLPRTLRAS